MNALNLLVLYLLVGLGCAFALWRAQPRAPRGQLCLCLLLWPLWAPLSLHTEATSESYPTDIPTPGGDTDPVARIRTALDDGVDSARGTPLKSLMNTPAATQILSQAERVDGRRRQLAELLTRPEFSPERARARLVELERRVAEPSARGTGAGEHGHQPGSRAEAQRAAATARVHLDNVLRLHALAERDREALEALADLSEALRAQLLLARLSGFSTEGVGAIVNDLWARVEGLGEALELDAEPFRTQPNPDPTNQANETLAT